MSGRRFSGAAGVTPPRRTLRATSGTIALIFAGAVAVLLLGDALVRAGVVEMLRLVPWVLLAVWAVYVLLYASHITFDREGATVQNYLRITRVPWPRVRDIAMRWQVVFGLDDGSSLPAYGGPVAGRPGRAPRTDRTRSAGTGPADPSPGRAVPAALRDVAELRDAWQGVDAWQSGDAAGAPAGRDAGDLGIQRSWDVPALVALAVIVVGAVISALSTTA
ncbi:hypothetical protein G3N30_05320 [Microbacterium lacticum]|uniref:hypothetical protein n=1 Tax=Microbacterium lacticum TaxID=33885 RepID=UPI0018B03C2D|nr:hypothetical protein [Microbacterium lacticum]MBF9335673.1 hypothetical protein [Microbacterium lacticum]